MKRMESRKVLFPFSLLGNSTHQCLAALGCAKLH